jgi:hypothetical protein
LFVKRLNQHGHIGFANQHQRLFLWLRISTRLSSQADYVLLGNGAGFAVEQIAGENHLCSLVFVVHTLAIQLTEAPGGKQGKRRWERP